MSNPLKRFLKQTDTKNFDTLFRTDCKKVCKSPTTLPTTLLNDYDIFSPPKQLKIMPKRTVREAKVSGSTIRSVYLLVKAENF